MIAKKIGRKFTKEEFIEKAYKIHKDKYSYELVQYINSRTNVKIKCNTHGVFKQLPLNHFAGRGCPKCGLEKINSVKGYTLEKFITIANTVHDSFYDYSHVKYNGSRISVPIECPIHGIFKQQPDNHLFGGGCKKCADAKQRKLTPELRGLSNRIRSTINSSFFRKGFTKNSITSLILGCTWEEFKTHLEDNPHNFKIIDEGLDLDHIIPISSAKSEEELYSLNHYTNFQLLPSEYNRHIKRANIFDISNLNSWVEANRITV